jgi:hypothetical protein
MFSIFVGMVGENQGSKTTPQKKGSKQIDEVIDRLNHGIEDLDEMVMDEDSIIKETKEVSFKDSIIEGHFKKPSDIEKDISWNKEETVPIHELVIRNPKDRGLKKRK